MALAVAEIKAKRSAFYHAGEAFILSAAEFTEQWEAVDNFYTHNCHTAKCQKVYYNCRLNQTRIHKIADKKPEGYVNPSHKIESLLPRSTITAKQA